MAAKRDKGRKGAAHTSHRPLLGRRNGRDASNPESDSETAELATDVLTVEIDQWLAQPRESLGEIMLGREWFTVEQLDRALATQVASGKELGSILLSDGVIDERQLAQALADQFDIPFADLLVEVPQPEALELVGEELCRRFTVLPMFVAEERLHFAVANPFHRDAIVSMTQRFGRVGVLVASESEILRVLDQTFDALRAADVHIQAFELVDSLEESEEQAAVLTVDSNAPIVQVVNRIVTQGVRSRASDIHIEPYAHEIRVRYRIDGSLSDAIKLPIRMGPPLASRVKVLADLNIVERRRPQDGQFSMTVDGRPIDVRTSVVATIHGETIVMRLLDKTRSLISLRELGMPDSLADSYVRIAKAPLGMMLCTGPTGSGKTTTLYATLNEVNDDSRNVVTIEDPVEYEFDGINQMQISEANGVTFADGLRGILRQDPDVILVGEIRDIETARIATQAALTGHFVLSSLHAVDAVSALHRFIDMGIEPFLVASAISGIVGQRLIRRTCNSCRAAFNPSPEQIRAVQMHTKELPSVWMKGTGCPNCNGTGFRGRIGVYELLEMTEGLRELVCDRATHADMRELAISDGMSTMQTEAFKLVVQGLTTVEEVLRSVYAQGVDLGAKSPVRALGPGPRALDRAEGTVISLQPEDDQSADEDSMEVSA